MHIQGCVCVLYVCVFSASLPLYCEILQSKDIVFNYIYVLEPDIEQAIKKCMILHQRMHTWMNERYSQDRKSKENNSYISFS